MFWYIRSWNAARSDLKPVVLVFARLFAITAICVFCASRPVFAAHSARFIVNFLFSWSFVLGSRHHALRALFVLVDGIDALDLQFIQTLQCDHIDQGLRGVDVARLQFTRDDGDGLVGLG